jgi:hypothetical protein
LSTYTCINIIVEQIRLLEDELIGTEDTPEGMMLNYFLREEPVEYQLIACSKCKVKYICTTELKMHEASKHTFLENI